MAPSKKRAMRPGLSSPRWRSRREQSIGVRVSETMAEMTTAMESVSANSRNMRPTRPLMKRSGMKTAIRENVSEMTVKPISRAPFSAACIGVSPFSMWRTMFSIMTMASSTTKPVPMVRAIRERLSSEKSANHITPKVAISDTGSVMPAMMVARMVRRNSSTTSTTRATLRTSVNCTSCTEARMVPVRSLTTVSLMPVGMERSMRGSSALMRCTVSITLAPG